MAVALSDMNLGKVDGKAEFSEAKLSSAAFFDSYLIPDNVRFRDFDDGDVYFIQGFRGTGKTSLLRYYLFRAQEDRACRRLILFKSIGEEDRVTMSMQSGIDWTETDSGKMGFSQDFKTSWKWFILHKIGEMILANRDIVAESTPPEKFLHFLGLGGEATIEKAFGVFPKLAGGKVKVSGNLGLFQASMEGDFHSKSDSRGEVPLNVIVAAAQRELIRIVFTSKLVLGFDELEAFYTDQEKFTRDLCMVRDLLFVIDLLNQQLRDEQHKLYLIAAVRSEVLFSMKSLGQEIERTIHDHGITLAWHHAQRSLNHPLIEMVRKKLLASGVTAEGDVFLAVFPKRVQNQEIERYILDGSFYKPRDIIWRLTIIRDQYPNATRVTPDMFERTEVTYSQNMWGEVEYELSANYSAQEVAAIKRMLSGFWRYFTYENFLNHANKQADFSSAVKRFISRHDIADLLHSLYRLGAIGNDFPLDSHGKRRSNRWIFRNEPDLLIDKQMAVNKALWKTLSLRTKYGGT